MRRGAITSHKALPAAKSGAVRARSVPSSRPFNVAAFFSSLYFLGLVTTVTAFVLFVIEPSQTATKVILGGMVFSILMWLVSFVKRRSAHCPLCKGTPMINSGAFPHVRARRLYPFNHGVTATLSVICTQKFRCMYCGSDYDLLKVPSHRRGKPDDYTA